jgi:hypothetical protein
MTTTPKTTTPKSTTPMTTTPMTTTPMTTTPMTTTPKSTSRLAARRRSADRPSADRPSAGRLSTRRRKARRAVGVATGLGALGLAAAVAAPTSAGVAGSTGPSGDLRAGAPAPLAACVTTWGSLPEARPGLVAGPLTNLRSGQHACFDRLVVDLRGKAPGYRVAYVDALVQQGSGVVYPVRGGAKIKITVNAPSSDANGTVVYQPANPAEAVPVGGYRTLRQVRWMGSFEGYSEFGVGVRARLPFRVFTLTDATGSRLVVDVAHTWR